MSRYKQGQFRPINPSKYKGNSAQIFWRSSWERHAMSFFDTNSSILEWSSEEIFVVYFDSATNRKRRYFPDFIIKYQHRDGSIRTAMIEVKPACQVAPPVKKSKITKRYLNEVKTFATNTSKWDQARKYCEVRGWDFLILTENEIFGKHINKKS